MKYGIRNYYQANEEVRLPSIGLDDAIAYAVDHGRLTQSASSVAVIGGYSINWGIEPKGSQEASPHIATELCLGRYFGSQSDFGLFVTPTKPH